MDMRERDKRAKAYKATVDRLTAAGLTEDAATKAAREADPTGHQAAEDMNRLRFR